MRTFPNGTFTTTAYIPSDAAPDSVVILSSGFFQTGAGCAPCAHRLATWGIVTFLRDDANLGEATPKVASDVGYMIDTWLSVTNSDAAQKAQVMATAVRYMTAFFARLLLGDTTVGPTFEGAGVHQDVSAGLIRTNAK